jgi:hypothetical protein
MPFKNCRALATPQHAHRDALDDEPMQACEQIEAVHVGGPIAVLPALFRSFQRYMGTVE